MNVSRYQVLQILGQSRCTCTCRALDLSQTPPRTCVIKQVKPDRDLLGNLQNHPKQVIQVIRDRLKAIQHPQLPAWIDAFADPAIDPASDYCLYWVQDYIAGKSLATQLEQQSTFGATEIWEILASVLPVLQELHQHQIVHGDIKPENLICPAGSERLQDLGLVDSALPNLIPIMAGSPEYAAPEQVGGRATFASDLYSLGLTCLHLLTGMRPMALIGLNHWSAVCEPGLPDSLVQFLTSLTAPDPTQRYSSAKAAIAALERLRGQKLKPQVKPALPGWTCCATLTGHQGLFATVNAVAVSPDGNWLASASDDKTVRLWKSGISPSGTSQLQGHQGFVKAVAFHPVELILASGSQDRTIRVWDYRTGQILQTLTGHSHQINALAYSLTDSLADSLADSSAYSPDGLLASGSSDKTIRLWQNGDCIATLTGHRLAVNGLAFGRDERGQLLLVSGSSDGTVRLWELASRTCRQILIDHRQAVRTVAVSPTCIASGGEDRVIHVWNWSGELIQTLPGHSWTVTGLAFAPDGKTLVSASWDKTLKLWDLATGREVAILVGHEDSVCGVCFSPDGRIVSASQDRTLRIWLAP